MEKRYICLISTVFHIWTGTGSQSSRLSSTWTWSWRSRSKAWRTCSLSRATSGRVAWLTLRMCEWHQNRPVARVPALGLGGAYIRVTFWILQLLNRKSMLWPECLCLVFVHLLFFYYPACLIFPQYHSFPDSTSSCTRVPQSRLCVSVRFEPEHVPSLRLSLGHFRILGIFQSLPSHLICWSFPLLY